MCADMNSSSVEMWRAKLGGRRDTDVTAGVEQPVKMVEWTERTLVAQSDLM